MGGYSSTMYGAEDPQNGGVMGYVHQFQNWVMHNKIAAAVIVALLIFCYMKSRNPYGL